MSDSWRAGTELAPLFVVIGLHNQGCCRRHRLSLCAKHSSAVRRSKDGAAAHRWQSSRCELNYRQQLRCCSKSAAKRQSKTSAQTQAAPVAEPQSLPPAAACQAARIAASWGVTFCGLFTNILGSPYTTGTPAQRWLAAPPTWRLTGTAPALLPGHGCATLVCCYCCDFQHTKGFPSLCRELTSFCQNSHAHTYHPAHHSWPKAHCALARGAALYLPRPAAPEALAFLPSKLACSVIAAAGYDCMDSARSRNC